MVGEGRRWCNGRGEEVVWWERGGGGGGQYPVATEVMVLMVT